MSYVKGCLSKLFDKTTQSKEIKNFFKKNTTIIPSQETTVIPKKILKRKHETNSEQQQSQENSVKTKKNSTIESQIQTQEENPTSKTKKNKKKRLSNDDPTLLQTDEKLPKKDDPEKLSRTLFIGNLPLSVKQKDLITLFKKYGKIESVRLRSAVGSKPNLPKKIAILTKNFHPERQSINAYIVLKKRKSAKSAIELNGHIIEGNHIRVDLADKKEFDMNRSVFVGNLSFKMNEEELREFFEECGAIDGVRIVRDTTTGMGKGFGYVLFKSADAIILALEKHEQKFNGRVLRVFRCKKIKAKKIVNTNSTSTDDKPWFSATQTNAMKRISNKMKRLESQQKNPTAPQKRSFEGVRSNETRKERLKVETKIKAHKKLIKANKAKGK